MAEREDRFEAGDAVEVAAPCGRRFSEELLSGYLDGALTQGEDQRVRLHLEDCAACRALYAELTTMRETTMKTRFVLPADDQWDERPRGSLSRLFRGTGWTLTVGWLVALALFAAWQLATGPGERARKAGDLRRGVGGRRAVPVGVHRPPPGAPRGPLPEGEEVIVTTTRDIAHKRIVRTLGLVRGNTIRARHIGRDIMAIFRNIIGGEVSEYTKLLAESREQALDRMIEEAREIGANAIVEVRFSTSEVMAGAAELMAYGTAVVVEDGESAPS